MGKYTGKLKIWCYDNSGDNNTPLMSNGRAVIPKRLVLFHPTEIAFSLLWFFSFLNKIIKTIEMITKICFQKSAVLDEYGWMGG